MKTTTLFALLVSLVFSTLTLAGNREETAWQMIEEGALVVDVRSEREYAGGHLDGSMLIPHNQVLDQFARREIPKDRPVVLYCRSGNRSGMAVAALRDAGYTQIFNGGGYQMLMDTAK